MERLSNSMLQHINFTCALIQRQGISQDEARSRWPSLHAMIKLAGKQLADDARTDAHERREREQVAG